MGGNTSEQPPFYVPEGQPNAGNIQNPNAAHELANLEDPVRRREQELKRQSETGLTNTERANIELMNGLEEKFPLAFEKIIDDKGRKILTIGVTGAQDKTWGLGDRLFITQEGVLSSTTQMGGALLPERVNFTKLMDHLQFGDYQEDRSFVMFDHDVLNPGEFEKFFPRKIVLNRVDLTDENILERMKYQFTERTKFMEQQRQQTEEHQIKIDPQNILSKF